MAKLTHLLKTIEPHFSDVSEGRKTFELRKDDRSFQVGEYIELRLHPPPEDRPIPRLRARIQHLVRGPVYGLAEGHVILSLGEVEDVTFRVVCPEIT